MKGLQAEKGSSVEREIEYVVCSDPIDKCHRPSSSC